PDAVKDGDLYKQAKTSVNGLLHDNLIDGPHADQLNSFIETNKDNPQALRQGIDHYAKMHMGASELASQAKSDAETYAAKIKGNTEPWKEVTPGMFYNVLTGESKGSDSKITTPAMMESKYVGIQQRQSQGQPISADDQAFAKGFEKIKTLVPQFNIAMQNGLLKNPAMDMAAE